MHTNGNGIIQLSADSDWNSYYDVQTMYIIAVFSYVKDTYAVVGIEEIGIGYPWIKVMNYDNTPLANTDVTIRIYCNKVV